VLIGLLGSALLLGGLAFGALVKSIGAPVVWGLGFALATYGAWLLVQAVRGPG
jgi:hypothetical protein